MKELKKCPFCGGEAVVEMDESWYWYWEAHCVNCSVTLGYFETREEAIKVWNTRKPMERIVETLEETRSREIRFCPPRANNKTVMLGQNIGLDRAIEIVKEEMQ